MLPFFFFDWTMVLLLPAMALALSAVAGKTGQDARAISAARRRLLEISGDLSTTDPADLTELRGEFDGFALPRRSAP